MTYEIKENSPEKVTTVPTFLNEGILIINCSIQQKLKQDYREELRDP